MPRISKCKATSDDVRNLLAKCEKKQKFKNRSELYDFACETDEGVELCVNVSFLYTCVKDNDIDLKTPMGRVVKKDKEATGMEAESSPKERSGLRPDTKEAAAPPGATQGGESQADDFPSSCHDEFKNVELKVSSPLPVIPQPRAPIPLDTLRTITVAEPYYKELLEIRSRYKLIEKYLLVNDLGLLNEKNLQKNQDLARLVIYDILKHPYNVIKSFASGKSIEQESIETALRGLEALGVDRILDTASTERKLVTKGRKL